MSSIGEELANIPVEEMVGSIGRGIAQAQYDIDMTGVRIAQLMSGFNEQGQADDANRVTFGQKDANDNLIRYSLLELGFTPTFYQFTETTLEVKVSLTISRSVESSRSTSSSSASASGKISFFGGSAKARARVSSVNASYSNKYQYSAEGSSMMKTKITPVPAPALLNERIRSMLEDSEQTS
jgi:hypothetical protein